MRAVHDVVVRGGTIYDGTGGAPFDSDVAIDGDHIVAIGAVPEPGAIELDARGLAVAPGLINMLSWATTSLIADGRSQSDIRQGVTLEVFGEGWSLGPVNDAMRREQTEQQGDIQYDITWTTLVEALDTIADRGISPNIASFVGAASVRIHELAHDDRPPTAPELERMRGLVDAAMREGAFGLGSALIYAPATYADTNELVALAEVAGRHGGMYISHMRSEGDRLVEAVDEVIEIARRAKLPAEIYHLKQAGSSNWNKLDAVIDRVERARGDGFAITADMYPYEAGATGLSSCFPPWAHEGGLRATLARLRDVAMDLVLEDESRVGMVIFMASADNLRREVALPWMSFGSDAGSLAPEGVFLLSQPHPRAYGTFARVLGRFVRDERAAPLEDVIRRMTGLPAENLKVDRRGLLRRGHFADIVAFDAGAIADHATYADPHRYATGVAHVLVNGTPVLRDGEHTGARPGRVLFGPARRGG